MLLKKKSVVIIGVGRFGTYLATKFSELGNEVMIIDKSEENINNLVHMISSAQIGDCTNIEVLKCLGVANFDICFVCISSNFQAAMEITYLIKELGAKYVIAKTNSDMRERFLLRNGADEVVYPERESANKAAIRLSSNQLFDYIELTPDYYLLEIPPPDAWMGESIASLSIRFTIAIVLSMTKIPYSTLRSLVTKSQRTFWL